MITFDQIMEQHEKDKAEVAALPQWKHRYLQREAEKIQEPRPSYLDPEPL